MLFAQLGRAHSLREICGGLASCEGKLAHLGAAAPRRSTLAYANAHRPWTLYQAVFYQVLARCREVGGIETVPVQKQVAQSRRDGDRSVRGDVSLGGVSSHQRRGEAAFHARSRRVLADLPGDHRRQTPRGADGAGADRFSAGTILVVDKGYIDFAWFAELTAAGVFFVTRLKRNADYTVVERRIPPQHRGMVCDQIIRFRGPVTRQKYPGPLAAGRRCARSRASASSS